LLVSNGRIFSVDPAIFLSTSLFGCMVLRMFLVFLIETRDRKLFIQSVFGKVFTIAIVDPALKMPKTRSKGSEQENCFHLKYFEDEPVSHSA